MSLNAVAQKLKRRSKDHFKGPDVEASPIVQAAVARSILAAILEPVVRSNLKLQKLSVDIAICSRYL